MKFMPVGIRLAGKPVLVVGGGAVGVRKIRTLLLCGARVTVVSPQPSRILRRLADAGKIIWKKRAFGPADKIAGRPAVIFACTSSESVNRRLGRLAASAGIWINRADSPNDSDVHVPSVARFGGLTIAIFSGGLGPAFVKYLRKRLERELGSYVASELRLLGNLRRRLKKHIPSANRRKRILTQLLKDGSIERLARRPAREREMSLRSALERWK